MARTRGGYRDLYLSPPELALTFVAAAAVAVNMVAFFDTAKVTVVLALIAAAAAMIGGLVLHFRVMASWKQRNERHREWLATQPPTEMLDLRAQLVVRERDLERARQDWIRPLCAAFAVTLSAVIVPYMMISSLAPDPSVEPLNTLWALLSLAVALTCVVLTVLAGRRQERTGGSLDPWSADQRHIDA